jgi:16S rRNA (cytosine967-C5)-methyltransferase
MSNQFRNAPGRRPALQAGDSLVIQIAAEVIGKSSRKNPADAVLRDVLGSRRLLTREQTKEISRAVFNYFRWFGWLERERPLPGQIKCAMELAQGFAERPQSFSDEKLVERCVPDWVREQMEVSPAWVRAIQSEPKLWLRARHGQGGALVVKLGAAKLEKDLLPDVVIYKGEEDLFRRAEFHAGEFEIQDLASQAVGWLCAPQPGETWWDACAGGGGKMLHLSDLMENKGLIWASDRAEWRLKNLKRRAARAKVFNFRSALWDGGAKLPTKTKFDGVLVDAPCSGVGTWQRNPHARWTTTLQDVQELAQSQKQILGNVAASVKPGGKLIYSVCTLTQAETSGVVKTFSEAHGEFELLSLPELKFAKDKSRALPPPHGFGATSTSAAAKTIWPQDCGGNGMFIAGWRRKP